MQQPGKKPDTWIWKNKINWLPNTPSAASQLIICGPGYILHETHQICIKVSCLSTWAVHKEGNVKWGQAPWEGTPLRGGDRGSGYLCRAVCQVSGVMSTAPDGSHLGSIRDPPHLPPTINYPYQGWPLTLQCCWMLKDKHRWTGKKSIFLLIINITKWPRIPSLRSGSGLDSALGFRLWLGCRKMPAASLKRTQNASKSYAWLKPYSKP